MDLRNIEVKRRSGAAGVKEFAQGLKMTAEDYI